jgi:hypothetical protein
MKRSLAMIILFGILALAVLPMASCALPPATYAVTEPIEVDVATPRDLVALQPQATTPESCAQPAPELAAVCASTAQHILAATARLELRTYEEGWDGRAGAPVERIIGHGTVRDGRYVITHSHYHLAPGDYGNGRLIDVSVYRADGSLALNKLPANAIVVTIVNPETLMFDFGTYGSQGLLSMAGFASAEFGTLAANTLRPGMEVAQVDWDGQQAWVEWVPVMVVELDGDTPHLVLDHYIAQGASGGGVFFRGIHVATNWLQNTAQMTSGEVIRQYSIAALVR